MPITYICFKRKQGNTFFQRCFNKVIVCTKLLKLIFLLHHITHKYRGIMLYSINMSAFVYPPNLSIGFKAYHQFIHRSTYLSILGVCIELNKYRT